MKERHGRDARSNAESAQRGQEEESFFHLARWRSKKEIGEWRITNAAKRALTLTLTLDPKLIKGLHAWALPPT